MIIKSCTLSLKTEFQKIARTTISQQISLQVQGSPRARIVFYDRCQGICSRCAKFGWRLDH